MPYVIHVIIINIFILKNILFFINMFKSFVLIIIGFVLFFFHKFFIQNSKDEFIVGDVLNENSQIKSILTRMSYIEKYNSAVYAELQTVVKDLLLLYYKYIVDERINVDDFSFYKQKLISIYEELSLNLPYKYYKRLRNDIKRLNKELDIKMELVKLKSFKTPIKLSLMNYKL